MRCDVWVRKVELGPLVVVEQRVLPAMEDAELVEGTVLTKQCVLERGHDGDHRASRNCIPEGDLRAEVDRLTGLLWAALPWVEEVAQSYGAARTPLRAIRKALTEYSPYPTHDPLRLEKEPTAEP